MCENWSNTFRAQFSLQAMLEHLEPPRRQVLYPSDLGDYEQHLLHPRLLRVHDAPLSPPLPQRAHLLVDRSQGRLQKDGKNTNLPECSDFLAPIVTTWHFFTLGALNVNKMDFLLPAQFKNR